MRDHLHRLIETPRSDGGSVYRCAFCHGFGIEASRDQINAARALKPYTTPRFIERAFREHLRRCAASEARPIEYDGPTSDGAVDRERQRIYDEWRVTGVWPLDAETRVAEMAKRPLTFCACGQYDVTDTPLVSKAYGYHSTSECVAPEAILQLLTMLQIDAIPEHQRRWLIKLGLT
jgi:hypothetical protein